MCLLLVLLLYYIYSINVWIVDHVKLVHLLLIIFFLVLITMLCSVS